MEYTTKLNLKKPEGTDAADITDINYNMDIIDAQLSSVVVVQTARVNITWSGSGTEYIFVTNQSVAKTGYNAIGVVGWQHNTTQSNRRQIMVPELYVDSTHDKLYCILMSNASPAISESFDVYILYKKNLP